MRMVTVLFAALLVATVFPTFSEAQSHPKKRAAASDLTFEIVQDNRAFEEFPPESSGRAMRIEKWVNVLIVKRLGLRLDLGDSDTYSFAGKDGWELNSHGGLDEKSVRLTWLIPDELLWASWHSLPGGSNGWISAKDVLVLKDNRQMMVLFETSCIAGNWAHCASDPQGHPFEFSTSESTTFEAEPGTRTVKMRLAKHMAARFWDNTAPLLVKRDVGGWCDRNVHYQEYGILFDSYYELAGQSLNRVRQENLFDLGKRVVDLYAVATFLVLFQAKKANDHGVFVGDCTFEEQESMVSQLRAVNPDLKKSNRCTGAIRIPFTIPDDWSGPLVR